MIEALTQGSAATDFKLSFDAYEEAIQKLEGEMQAVKKDFVVYRDRTSLEVRQGIELIRSTREDYIQRIKDIYDDQARIVRETQHALNTTRETVENQAQAVAQDNRVNSKMLMNFEKNIADITLEVRELKLQNSQVNRIVTDLGERVTGLK